MGGIGIEIVSLNGSPDLRFAPRFNVAVPFSDRHVSEGRGAKVALRTTSRDITYAELAADARRASTGSAFGPANAC